MPIRRVITRRAKDEFPSIPGVTTLYESLERSVKLNGSSPALGYRPIDSEGKAGDFEWITYSELESERLLTAGCSQRASLHFTCRACWPVSVRPELMLCAMPETFASILSPTRYQVLCTMRSKG